ncbi:LamG-like jellyroll fold domain-containing protein [Nitrosopumilus sp. S4]
MIIIISTAITYTTFSMNQVTQLAESVETKQIYDYERTTEKFEILNVRNDNNQFNMTIKNTGELPVHLTRLWIENTTDSTWPISKFDLDVSIPPGSTVSNIGQNIGLTALDTQSYFAQIISERGNQNQMYLNSVGDTSLFIRLSATPSVLPSSFTTAVILEVINTGTTQLVNLQPEMVSVSTPTCTNCFFEELQSATPSSFDSLKPGDTAIFEWVYSFDGENGDQIQFIAGLKNDIRTDTATVTLQTIESALNAEVAIESGGLGDQVLIDDDILLFHLETDIVDSGTAYQMWSGIGDGGGDGLRIQLDQTNPHFVTNNGSKAISIPEGAWTVAMMLKSEEVPTSLKGDGVDMIFHFEDGDGAAPDNSEGSSSRDLDECGVSNYVQSVSIGTNDAEERISNGNVDLSDGDLDLAYDGGENNVYLVGLRFTGLNITPGTIITSAQVVFNADESDSGLTHLRIYAEDIDDAPVFTNSNSNLSNRALTGNYTDWSNIEAWSTGEISSDTTTPNIAAVIQEVVDRPGWVSGNDIVLLFYDNGSSGQRAAESEEGGGSPPQLSITWGNGAVPDWQPLSGPHNSGSYYFDGTADCFRSTNNVSGGDDNDIGSGDSTTSLWFKTDSDVGITDQYFVDWSASGCPLCDYYRIGLKGDVTNGGKVFFEYSTDDGLDVVSCVSTNEYDDEQWYHVTAARNGAGDECRLEITNIAGSNPEGQIFVNANTGTSSVDVSGKWHVGSNVDEDGNFFKGWIDDIMHWDDYHLSNGEIDDLARTNYGDGAHEFDLYLDELDSSGTFVQNLYTGIATKTAFADPKNGGNNDDWAYSQTNMTFNLAQTVIPIDGRLELYFNYRPSTTSWEALEVDMKIDDTTMNNPYPSFMQIPFPSIPFPSYYVHDKDDEFELFISNTGEDGVFLTYQGTRVNFNGTGGAYAGLIKSVNGTNLSENQDSLYIPKGENAELLFHEATDIPSTTQAGNLITPGAYRTTIWINGYSDQGETFSRSVVVGSVTIVD